MRRLAACLAVFCASACAQTRLNIDRLYTLPWVIGSAPKAFAWSADSRRLAFLWNDEGTNFYDVWVADAQTGKPVRITHMPRPHAPLNPGMDIEKLQQAAKAETDAGVSYVTWSSNQDLLFLFKGQLYEVRPGAEPKLFSTLTNITAVKAAPTGGRIAYVAAGNLFMGNENLTHITKLQTSVEEFYWSNDGERIAYIESDESQMPVRGIPDYLGDETVLRSVKRPFPGEPSERRRLGIVTASANSKVQWAELRSDPLDLIFGVSWSPDSKTVLVDKSDLYIKDRRLLLVNPENGKASLLLREADPKNVTDEWWADWSPDGSGVYFTSDRENFYHVYYVPLIGGEPKLVTSGDWAVFSAVVSKPANALFFTSNEGRPEERHLYKLPLAGGQPLLMTPLAGTHTDTVSPDGTIAADYFSNDLTPPDLYFQKLGANEAAVKVTHSPLPEFTRYNWVPAQYVTFPSTADGVTLHGRLTLPPNFDKTKKYPAILGSVYSNTVHNQWGGRVAHPTWGLDQYLAQQGYVLLNVDIRGSLGYGKAFRQRLALDYGGIDVEDLYSGVKFLEKQGYVDMTRVGMWGSSYGGLLTANVPVYQTGRLQGRCGWSARHQFVPCPHRRDAHHDGAAGSSERIRESIGVSEIRRTAGSFDADSWNAR